MAKKSNNELETKGKKTPAKKQELSFGGKVKRFFGNLRNEIKLVVWPNRKEVKETTIVVLLVIAATVVLVFVVDSLMTGILSLSGFNTAAVEPPSPAPAVTAAATTAASETANTTGTTLEVTPPAETTKGN